MKSPSLSPSISLFLSSCGKVLLHCAWFWIRLDFHDAHGPAVAGPCFNPSRRTNPPDFLFYQAKVIKITATYDKIHVSTSNWWWWSSPQKGKVCLKSRAGTGEVNRDTPYFALWLIHMHFSYSFQTNEQTDLSRAARKQQRFPQAKKDNLGGGTNLLLYLPFEFSLCLLKRDVSFLSREPSAQTLGATCQPTFFALTQPSLLKVHTPPPRTSLSLLGSHQCFWKSSSLPVTPHLPTPPPPPPLSSPFCPPASTHMRGETASHLATVSTAPVFGCLVSLLAQLMAVSSW